MNFSGYCSHFVCFHAFLAVNWQTTLWVHKYNQMIWCQCLIIWSIESHCLSLLIGISEERQNLFTLVLSDAVTKLECYLRRIWFAQLVTVFRHDEKSMHPSLSLFFRQSIKTWALQWARHKVPAFICFSHFQRVIIRPFLLASFKGVSFKSHVILEEIEEAQWKEMACSRTHEWHESESGYEFRFLNKRPFSFLLFLS